MSRQREMRKLAREYRKRGWTVERTGSHMKFTPPDGGRFIIAAVTPGTMRAIYNVQADLRRAERRNESK